jgi:hypothetical protein
LQNREGRKMAFLAACREKEQMIDDVRQEDHIVKERALHWESCQSDTRFRRNYKFRGWQEPGFQGDPSDQFGCRS